MRETLKTLTERPTIFIIGVGGILTIISATDVLSLGTFSAQSSSNTWKIIIGIFGIVMIIAGVFLEVLGKRATVGKTKRFDKISDFYEYVKKRLEQVESQVDDISWGTVETEVFSDADKRARDEYIDSIARICQRKNVVYREVMGFPPAERIDRAENMLDKNIYNYHLRCYEYNQKMTPPLLSFIIIDGKELILGLYRSPYLSPEGEVRLATTEPEMLALFKDYFSTIWHNGKIIKEREQVNRSVLRDIRKRLTTAKN